MDSGLRQEDIAFWLSDQLTALEGGYGQRQRRWIRQPHILASNPFKASGSYFWKYTVISYFQCCGAELFCWNVAG